MINGSELVKMFSEYEENVEEKLYSTGDDTLDELLERAFCEGYEFAQHEFAKKNQEDNWSSKDDSDMKLGDKAGIWAQKHLNTQKDRDAVVEGHRNGNWHKFAKQSAKYAGGMGAALGVAGGIAVGKNAPKKAISETAKKVIKTVAPTKGAAKAMLKHKRAVVGTAAAAAGGTALGLGCAGAAYLGARTGGAVKNIQNEISRDSAEKSARWADRADVASGKMTKKEYLDRRAKRGH